MLNNYLSSENDEEMLLGSLSARYESNGNPAAISSGNDAGGVSFGAYQFASNAGVPKAFAAWCISSEMAVDIGQRLLEAYEADSDSCGTNFKSEWLEIAEEDADFFLLVQHEYVKEKYYNAIVLRIENNIPNFDIDMYGIALKNVFWSRSVQHGVGGSYNVITRAFEAIGGFALQSEEELIRAIYAESGALSDTGTYPMTGATAESLGIAGKYMKYYSRNSSAVQVSVYRRLNINELGQALEMLAEYGGYQPSEDTPYALGNIRTANVTADSAELFGTVYNYRLTSVTEYGFFIGKSLQTLIDMPVSKNETTAPVISFSGSTLSCLPELDPMTTYYYGIYAFIGGEYVMSEILTFVSGYATVYTASFHNFDGSLLYEVTLREGRTPIYSGEAPRRAPDAQFTYTFSGWDKDILPITENTVYTALYSTELNTYTVRYFDAKNIVIFECEVKYGENASFEGILPEKEPNKQYRFIFAGWKQSEEDITGNTDIYPKFDKTDLLWNGDISDSFAGGSGSEEDPYLISSASELAYLAEYVSLGGATEGKYFALTDNIVLGNCENRTLFAPIGSAGNPFSGNFDGCGYIISGLTVDSDSFAGLFGYTSDASVSNLIIKNAQIEGETAGILIGKAVSAKNCSVKNCGLEGQVLGKSYAGGAIGYAEGGGLWLTDMSVSGSVQASVSGGIIGYFGGTSLTNSYSDANVSGASFGNIYGEKNTDNLILNCYYFSEKIGNGLGKRLSAEELGSSSSYSGFDFNEKWKISDGKAMLTIAADNTYSYYVYGDVDCNGFLDARDAVLLAQYLAKWKITVSENFSLLADVTADGKVNAADAVLLAQYFAKWDVSLG